GTSSAECTARSRRPSPRLADCLPQACTRTLSARCAAFARAAASGQRYNSTATAHPTNVGPFATLITAVTHNRGGTGRKGDRHVHRTRKLGLSPAALGPA